MVSYEDALKNVKLEYKKYEEDLNYRVAGLCEKLVDINFSKYEKVHNDFAPFFDTDVLQTALNKKADLYLIGELNQEKIGHEEFKQIMDKINNVKNQLKHLSVNQLEMSKTLIPYKQQTPLFMDSEDNCKMIKGMVKLNKHAKIIQNWIGSDKDNDEDLVVMDKSVRESSIIEKFNTIRSINLSQSRRKAQTPQKYGRAGHPNRSLKRNMFVDRGRNNSCLGNQTGTDYGESRFFEQNTYKDDSQNHDKKVVLMMKLRTRPMT